jgi:hypothetical protein
MTDMFKLCKYYVTFERGGGLWNYVATVRSLRAGCLMQGPTGPDHGSLVTEVA